MSSATCICCCHNMVSFRQLCYNHADHAKLFAADLQLPRLAHLSDGAPAPECAGTCAEHARLDDQLPPGGPDARLSAAADRGLHELPGGGPRPVLSCPGRRPAHAVTPSDRALGVCALP